MYIAGDIKELKIQHPTLGDFVFEPKTNESITFIKGGTRINDDDNQVTSSGTPIYQSAVVRGSLTISVALNTDGEDYLSNWASSLEGATVVFTTINNISYTGAECMPTGNLETDFQAGTAEIKIASKPFTQI